MNNSGLYRYQVNNISKIIERLLEIDFSDIREVKELRRQLIAGISDNINFHMEMHTIDPEYHNCNEYESRTRFGRKMLSILNETIRELENASRS